MNINDYLDYVFNILDTNKEEIGIEDVFKHDQFDLKFESPAVFCEIAEEEEGEDGEKVFTVSAFLFVFAGDSFDVAREKAVEIKKKIEDAFQNSQGIDHYPPQIGVSYQKIQLQSDVYFLAELTLTGIVG